ncbi:MAG TPA: hypothetical protein VGO93_12660, partial [Candidatus Xenobia bacterium]
VILTFWLVLGVQAASARSVAFLIVTDNSDSMVAQQKKTTDRLIQLKEEAGMPKNKLDVMAANFKDAKDAAYCEQHLDIHAANLLFVGVVALGPDGKPDRVLFRIDNAQDPVADAQRAFREAMKPH